MIRHAYIMNLKPGFAEEYEKRHSPIPQDLHDMLKEHGVHNYSIYLDSETNKLFAFVEFESWEKWNKIADNPICKTWWAYGSEILYSHEDNSPMCFNLKEVFHMD